MDVDIVIQDAFRQVRKEKERVDSIEQQLSTNIELAEQAAKLFLKHLYELNIIKLDLHALGKEIADNVDNLSLPATVTLDTPTNRSLRLAMLIDEASERELIQALDYLKPEKKKGLLELL